MSGTNNLARAAVEHDWPTVGGVGPVTPLVLLVGFLGAGKTRFLTALIPLLHNSGLRVRVLLNDFENADIDASRLNALNALVTPLAGECVCCSSLRELMDALHAVPAEPNTVLLIEANGATEADELLGYLTTDRRLAHFTLPLQLTVIDAGRWQKRWWHNALEAAQATTATHLEFNWTHKLSAQRCRDVEHSVRTMNPRAQRTTPAQFADELRSIIDAGAHGRVRGDGPPHAAAAHAHTHRTAHPFATATWPLPATVERAAFLDFVRALPQAVVRAKGLVRFSDRPDEMFVWNRIGGRKGVQLDRSTPHAAASPVALFIGVDLPISELFASITALSAVASG